MSTPSAMDDLRKEFKTEVTAATEDFHQQIATFVREAQADLDRLKDEWSSAHKGLEAQTATTIKSATTLLRIPVEEAMSDVERQTKGMRVELEEQVKRMHAEFEEQIKLVEDRNRKSFEKQLDRLTQIHHTVRGQVWQLVIAMLIAFVVGAVLAKMGYL